MKQETKTGKSLYRCFIEVLTCFNICIIFIMSIILSGFMSVLLGPITVAKKYEIIMPPKFHDSRESEELQRTDGPICWFFKTIK